MLYRLIPRFCVLLNYLGIMSNFAHTRHYLKVIQTTLLILGAKTLINETTAHISTLDVLHKQLPLTINISSHGLRKSSHHGSVESSAKILFRLRTLLSTGLAGEMQWIFVKQSAHAAFPWAKVQD